VKLETADDRIRSLRPPRARVDPYRAHATLVEKERRPDGRIEQSLTVFLAGAECPFACSFCDLWQWTVDGPTPSGALTAQLEQALASHEGPMPDRVKLYNASNFFDPRAVPPADVAGIASLLRGTEAITVESHAATIGKRATDFARALSGRLEVALGLESIHPVAMAESNKRMDLARFDRAVSLLSEHEIDVRVFVLLGMPYVPPS
jgi:archaeosine synthase beta-subunit